MTSGTIGDVLEWGDVGGCRYLTTTRLCMASFLESCRGILDGRLIWVTSIDSGPFIPSEEERALGWSPFEGTAVSPLVTPSLELPFCGFDEWWVDVKDHKPLRTSGYCNYGTFALAGLAAREDAATNTSPTGVENPWEWMAAQQRQFWIAFWDTGAEMYVGDGDLFNFVCRDRRAFELVLARARR